MTMQKRKRRKHEAHKRALVVGNQHRPFFETTVGGKMNIAKLDTAVGNEATSISDLENSLSQHDAAAQRADEARRILTQGLRHVSTVGNQLPDDSTPTFEGSRPASDVELIGRLDDLVAGTSANTDAFVNHGVQPALLATLTSELAAFKKAKETITLSGKRRTEASAALDAALAEGDDATDVLEGILTTSPDAPVGALTALQQARRIGPRNGSNEQPATPTVPAPTPGPAVSPAPAVSPVPAIAAVPDDSHKVA